MIVSSLIISAYLDQWRLKLSTAKTTTTAFHLNTREANRELNISVNGLLLPYQSHPTYLGVKLDRKLTYRQHLEGLRSLLRYISARNFSNFSKKQPTQMPGWNILGCKDFDTSLQCFSGSIQCRRVLGSCMVPKQAY